MSQINDFSKHNLRFDFLAGTLRGLDPPKKMRIECLHLQMGGYRGSISHQKFNYVGFCWFQEGVFLYMFYETTYMSKTLTNVGTLQCGRTPMWAHSNVGALQCGRTPMSAHSNVGALQCGRTPMWAPRGGPGRFTGFVRGGWVGAESYKR